MSILASLSQDYNEPREFLPGAKEIRRASAHATLTKLLNEDEETFRTGVQELRAIGIANFPRTFEHGMFTPMLREIASEMKTHRSQRALAAALANTADSLEARVCNDSINGNNPSKKTTLASYRAKLLQDISHEFDEHLTGYPLGAKPEINFVVHRANSVPESARAAFSLHNFKPTTPLFFQIKGTGFDGPRSWGFYVEIDKSTGIISKILAEPGAREFLLTDLRVAVCASNALNLALTQCKSTTNSKTATATTLSVPMAKITAISIDKTSPTLTAEI